MLLLFIAAVNGNADVAKLLIKNDADIDLCDVDGKTALMIAVINGHQNLVELLLKSEADIKVKNAVSMIYSCRWVIHLKRGYIGCPN